MQGTTLDRLFSFYFIYYVIFIFMLSYIGLPEILEHFLGKQDYYYYYLLLFIYRP